MKRDTQKVQACRAAAQSCTALVCWVLFGTGCTTPAFDATRERAPIDFALSVQVHQENGPGAWFVVEPSGTLRYRPGAEKGPLPPIVRTLSRSEVDRLWRATSAIASPSQSAARVAFSRGVVAEWRAMGRTRVAVATSDQTDLAISLTELASYAGADAP